MEHLTPKCAQLPKEAYTEKQLKFKNRKGCVTFIKVVIANSQLVSSMHRMQTPPLIYSSLQNFIYWKGESRQHVVTTMATPTMCEVFKYAHNVTWLRYLLKEELIWKICHQSKPFMLTLEWAKVTLIKKVTIKSQILNWCHHCIECTLLLSSILLSPSKL